VLLIRDEATNLVVQWRGQTEQGRWAPSARDETWFAP
jgi:hypothetical protein